MTLSRNLLLAALLLHSSSGFAQKKHAPVREDIPFGRLQKAKMEEPVFAVCSKQGMRILVSRDDGKTWQQTFCGTESVEDGGWHGTFAVYGMAATRGVIGVFSGWGTPGVYIGSADGIHWTHLNGAPGKLGSVWGAAAGNGVFLTSADQWRGMTTSNSPFTEWKSHKLKELLNGGKTHHMISGFGDYSGGRFVIVGDNRHVFFSDKTAQEWKHSLIPEGVGERQDSIVFGNGVFLVNYRSKVARSTDGGQTWAIHETGLDDRGASWRGLSFVRGEFWLTGRSGGRASRDGITWRDLPADTPAGRFVVGDSGTIINVERRRYDIKRSVDGKTWKSVFKAPKEDVTWDTAFAVFQHVNAAN